MDNRLMKLHENGQRHPGKTDWEKIALSGGKPASDEENPVLVYKKVFKKPESRVRSKGADKINPK